jgi:hypothetical protein
MPQADTLRAIRDYLSERPGDLLVILRNLTQLRITVPLVLVRELLERLAKPAGVSAVDVEARPPGVMIRARLRALGAELRVGAALTVEAPVHSPAPWRVAVRVRDVELSVLEGSSALSALIASGSLNLSRIGDLLARLPRRPAFVAGAERDSVVLDLLRLPFLNRPEAAPWVEFLTSTLEVRSIATVPDYLEIQVAAAPGARRVVVQRLQGLARRYLGARFRI